MILLPVFLGAGPLRAAEQLSAIPADSEIQIQAPNTWRMYHHRIIGVVALCISEMILIVALLYERRIRSQAEEDLRSSKIALKVAATQAKQQSERLQLMFDFMPTAILLVDSHGAIQLANQRAEALFGYSRSALQHMSIEQLIPDRFRSGREQSQGHLLQAPNLWTLGAGRDFYCVREDGREVPVELGSNKMKLEDGVFTLVSIIDISERRKAELEAQRQREQLTHLSRVEMLSHFSGSLAHELNQPLTAMLTNAQVASRLLGDSTPDITELRAIMTDIATDIRRASDIVIQLRGWLKKESQRSVEYNINRLVEEVVTFLKGEFMFNKATCTLFLDRTLMPLRCDRVQIQQVIVNLLRNALESGSSASNEHRNIVIRTVFSEGSQVVSVQDDGDGISEAIRANLFQPFVTTKKSGFGMGLSICKSIVQNHKGKIWVENNSKRGATFYFSLPVPVLSPV